MDYDPTYGHLALILAIYGVIIVSSLIFAVGAYVLTAVALMQFFRKVGVEPWAAWIPVYGYWKWLEVGGQPGPLALLTLVPYGSIVTTVFLAIGMYRTGFAFRKDSSWVVLGIFLPWLWCFLLARRTETYQPELISQAGFPPPRAGFGSVPA